MPHWDKNGNEEWVCQPGEHICTGASIWVEGVGNCCPRHREAGEKLGAARLKRVLDRMYQLALVRPAEFVTNLARDAMKAEFTHGFSTDYLVKAFREQRDHDPLPR